jgi:N-acyl amino acid synthase of PEP-CTERM/exosortase system
MLYSQAVERRQFSPIGNTKFFDTYNCWFNVIPANTPELREKAYRLRYQVYCCENQYEHPNEHPLQMETDEYDCRSIHSLVIDRTTGESTGTVRLILPDTKSPGTGLPIEQTCNHSLPENIRRDSTAEISRFAISKKMRKKIGEDCPKDLKCAIALGLMREIVQISMRNAITDWLAVMEPSLLRLLCRFGIYFTPIGPLVEYHGVRQPCHADSNTLLGRVRREHFELWEFLTEPVC